MINYHNNNKPFTNTTTAEYQMQSIQKEMQKRPLYSNARRSKTLTKQETQVFSPFLMVLEQVIRQSK